MKPHFLFAMALLSVYSVSSQESKNENTHNLKAISIQVGVLNDSRNYSKEIENFDKLAPSSTLLKRDFTEFDRSTDQYSQTNGVAFSANGILSLNTTNEKLKKLNPEFNIGLSYNEIEILSASLSRIRTYRIDTISPNPHGEREPYVDSVSSKLYFFSYSQEQLFVDLGIKISSNAANRWQLYSGLSGSIGIAINPSTTASYLERSEYESELPLYNTSYESEIPVILESENFKNKTAMTFMLSLLFGVDLRLSQTQESLKQYHLFLETRPNIALHTIENLSSEFSTSNFYSIGFRYDLPTKVQ